MTDDAQKIDCLVHGYVSSQLQDLQLASEYPAELNMVITQFLGNVLMRFDLFNEKYRDCVQKDGTWIIKHKSIGNDYFSVLSSHTFAKGEVGEFKIKCIRPGGDSIGITSNKDIILDKNVGKYHTIQDKPVYYYRGPGHFNGTGGQPIRGQKNVSKWKANDIITVKVDCVEWTVSFLHNDVIQGGDAALIDIEPNKVYYPFIGFIRNKGTTYKLLE